MIKKDAILPSRYSCAEMLDTYTCRIVFCSPSLDIASAASSGGNSARATANAPGPMNFLDEPPGLYHMRISALTAGLLVESLDAPISAANALVSAVACPRMLFAVLAS